MPVNRNADGSPILDAATIGAFQNMLGVPVTMVWDQATAAAFANFQNAKGWGQDYGLRGDQAEWADLTGALTNHDYSVRYSAPPPAPTAPTAPGTPTTPAPGPTGPTGPTSEQKSAQGYVNDLLRSWGLEELGGWAWDQILDGTSASMLPSLIRQTDVYKARFSGLEARRASGKNVLSEGQYLQLENDYQSVMHRYGIPSGIFDTQSYMAGLISADLSPSELNDRLRIYQDAAYNAPTEVRSSLTRLYGVTEGGLMAYYINPDMALPVLESQYAAAGAASAAQRAGFAEFGVSTSERLAQLGAGADDVSAFDQLKRSRELFNPLGYTEGGSSLSDDQAAIATFGGDAEGNDTMRRRAEGRVAEFAGGGSFTQSQGGVTGLGQAR